MSKYKLLVTEDSFSELYFLPRRRNEVHEFLLGLIDGRWEKDKSVVVWKGLEENRFLFSCKVADEFHAVWERAMSLDLGLKVLHDVEQYVPHILLHWFSVRRFPGEQEDSIRMGKSVFKRTQMAPDEVPFKERPLDELRYEKEYRILPPNLIEKVIEGSQRGLILQMPKDEIEVILKRRRQRGPTLLQGEAGCGKTSLIIVWLILNELESGDKPLSQLFVTLSELLRDRAKQEFESVLPFGHKPRTEFKSYYQLLQEIHRGAASLGCPPKDWNKRMTFQKFMSWARGLQIGRIDPVLLWDEIRSVIKGWCLDPERPMLTLEEYVSVSERKGKCKVPKRDRPSYYKAAQKYQQYLNENGFWDDIDLARECLRYLKMLPSEKYKYDKIACDEVQDLSPIEIKVLTECAKNVDDMLFAGDVEQVINPSGFSWEKLKGLLGEIISESRRHEIQDPECLKRNFRSTPEIVDLVNKVRRLKGQLLGLKHEKIEHSGVYSGFPPTVLDFSPIEKIKELPSHPYRRCIIVKTEDEKERVIKLIGEETRKSKVNVLTVNEAKGLDWEGVLLWNFFIPRHEITKDVWERIFVEEKRKFLEFKIRSGEENPYAIAYEFNLLHVGLSRPRKFLLVYDEVRPGIRGLVGELNQLGLEEFERLWSTAGTPEDFREEARKIENVNPEDARAYYAMAGDAYARDGNHEEAAKCYEAARKYAAAAEQYKISSNWVKAEEMLALQAREQAEKEKNKALKHDRYLEEAEHWKAHLTHVAKEKKWEVFFDHLEFASQAYEKAGEPKLAAETLEWLARLVPSEAAEEYFQARREAYEKAATYWEKENNLKNAVDSLKQALAIVEEQISKRINPGAGKKRAAMIHLKISDLLKKLNKFEEAAFHRSQNASYLEQLGDYSASHWHRLEASRLYKQAGKSDQSMCLLCRDLEMLLDKALGDTEIASTWDELAELLKKMRREKDLLENLKKLIKFYIGRGNLDGALEKVNENAKWLIGQKQHEEVLDLLNQVQNVAKEKGRNSIVARTLELKGLVADSKGDVQSARRSYLEAGRTYLEMERLEAALKSFEKAEIIIKSKAGPFETGQYCFEDVGLDLIARWNGEAEKENYMIEAIRWLNRAADYFAREPRQSLKYLEGHIRELKKRKATAREIGWGYYCLYKTHEIRLGTEKLAKDKVKMGYLAQAFNYLMSELVKFASREFELLVNHGLEQKRVELLKKIKDWALKTENYELVGKVSDGLGKFHLSKNEFEKAKRFFLEAGKAHLKRGLLERALESFYKGEKSIEADRVGAALYCIKDVAIESLISEYGGSSEKESYKKEAIKWIEKGIKKADSPEKLIKALQSYASRLSRRMALEKKELDLKRGWAYYSISLIYAKLPGKEREQKAALRKAYQYVGSELEA